MVCMGNTCRSPIAQAVFHDEVVRRGLQDKWFVDSAATRPYHVGKPPSSNTTHVLEMNQLSLDHLARQINPKNDFTDFEFILGMDSWNVSDIRRVAPNGSTTKIQRLADYDPVDKSDIYDPYGDHRLDGFEECFVRCQRSVKAFLDQFTDSTP